MYKIANTLSTILDIALRAGHERPAEGGSHPVPADGFYLLAVVINVAIVVLISGALAPAR